MNTEESTEETKNQNRRISYDSNLSPSQRGELKPFPKYMKSKQISSENKRLSSDNARTYLTHEKPLPKSGSDNHISSEESKDD